MERPLTPPLSSSPPRASDLLAETAPSQGCRAQKPPSITPRRFSRFFNLSSAEAGLSPPGSSPAARGGAPLRPLRPSATNRAGRDATPESLDGESRDSTAVDIFAAGDENAEPLWRKRAGEEVSTREIKRQAVWDDGSGGGNAVQELRRNKINDFFSTRRMTSGAYNQSKIAIYPAQRRGGRQTVVIPGFEARGVQPLLAQDFNTEALLLQQGTTGLLRPGQATRPVADYRFHTAGFCSSYSDSQICQNYERPGFSTVPFSIATSHSSPLAAVGCEEGYIRMIDTNSTQTSDEAQSPDEARQVRSHFKCHSNAINDLDFSLDDRYLATACGDQSGKIIDVATQKTTYLLSSGHYDSLRQVKFQPGSAGGNILATSDRAGRIQIWDLRCASAGPLHSISDSQGVSTDSQSHSSRPPKCGVAVNTIDYAHRRLADERETEASVTALQWLAPGREHLLLSGSEVNSSIRLWDTRFVRPRKRLDAIPVSSTPCLGSHGHRDYAVTSLALSTDSSKVFALCKDNTVYAFSTEHFIVGHAPELSRRSTSGYPYRPVDRQGLGPLYGIRHPDLDLQSFYVRMSLRRARPGVSELLAVGSSTGSPVLIPTEDQHLAPLLHDREWDGSAFERGAATSGRTPILEMGTALRNGHSEEVTSVRWGCDGTLVTASDDRTVRAWRVDGERARGLRRMGESDPERHGCGFAAVDSEWDDDEEVD